MIEEMESTYIKDEEKNELTIVRNYKCDTEEDRIDFEKFKEEQEAEKRLNDIRSHIIRCELDKMEKNFQARLNGEDIEEEEVIEENTQGDADKMEITVLIGGPLDGTEIFVKKSCDTVKFKYVDGEQLTEGLYERYKEMLVWYDMDVDEIEDLDLDEDELDEEGY